MTTVTPLKDSHGHTMSGATAAAIDHFETATHELRCYVGDPLAGAKAALEAAPQMVMGHALVAWLNLLGTEPGGLAEARAALAAARALPGVNEREGMHLAAIEHLLQGRWHDASRQLEDLSIRFPTDALALQAGHQIDFFTGHSRMLRDRIARALPEWHAGMPGYHAVLGMHAFGLEETGDYAAAERVGRQCVELERRDGWGWHAVAHVLEMQNRRRDGIAWMKRDTTAWSEGSFFAVHNAWHLALFHLGLEETDEVFAIIDQRVLGHQSAVVLDMIDASAMLWRLMLRGVGVGDRWSALADRWAAVTHASEGGNYAFNDLHAMMAFVGAGRGTDADALIEAQQRTLRDGHGDNVMFLREVGHDATRAVRAFVEGDAAGAVRLLRPLRSHAHRFGGSHAQRDIIDLTLIAAAEKAGERLLARALRNERVARA